MTLTHPPTRTAGESGLVSIWGFLFMIILLGFAGLAFDVWHIWEVKRDLQSVADSAALAGAGGIDEDRYRDPNTNDVRLDRGLADAYARDAIAAQGDLPTLSTPAVVQVPPSLDWVDVQLETEVDLTLLRLFTVTSSIEVEAQARSFPLRSTACGDPVCTPPTTTPSP